MKNVLLKMSVLMLSACDVAYQVGAGPDAGGGGSGPATGGSSGSGGGSGGDNTRSLAFACDLWDTGKPMSSLSGGPWHWFSHAVILAWGDKYKNDMDVVEQVSERYLPLIKTTGDLECVTRDLLWDARARGTLGSFYQNWLELDPTAPPEASPYTPVQWSEMVQDTLTFAIDTTASGVDNFRRLYTSPRPVTLAPNADPSKVVARETLQAGLLSDSAVVARAGVRDFPTFRGVWFWETFVCQGVPAPPPGRFQIELGDPVGGSLRQRLENAVSEGACGPCHKMPDPIGFAMAPLDSFGRVRDRDPFGFRFDTTGDVSVITPELKFDDLNTLGASLARTSEAALCYAARWNNFLFEQDLNNPKNSTTAKAGDLLLSNRGDMRAAIAHVIVQGMLP